MTITVASLWRHPIKAVGREEVAEVVLTEGQTFPGDRLWSVAHEASKAVEGEWSRCSNFIRAASSPALMAVEAHTYGDRLRLTHPDRQPLDFDPAVEGAKLVDWVAPLVAEGRAAPTRLVPAPQGQGMTDASEPLVSLGSLTSHRIVEARLGHDVSIHRWRCNIWLNGLAPWEEFDLVDKTFRLGKAELKAYARITRCQSTSANPATGRRDADLLSVLDHYGHQDFTIGAMVTKTGRVAPGDELEVL